MSTKLILLGHLKRGPLHGYELKHIIEEHMGDWTNIAFGSIYFALGKLREEGSIKEAERGSAGKRPEKTVYAITESGEAEFGRLLRELLGRVERQYYEIDIGLAFVGHLRPGEGQAFFSKRAASLGEWLKSLKAHEREALATPYLPPQAKCIFSHSRRHLEAEISWTKEVLGEIEAGRL